MSERPVIAPEDCPEPFWHETHLYCPVCSWQEEPEEEPVSPSLRAAVVEVLLDHQAALDERRQQRTETTWPDESDIYTGTIIRLRTLFKRAS